MKLNSNKYQTDNFNSSLKSEYLLGFFDQDNSNADSFSKYLCVDYPNVAKEYKIIKPSWLFSWIELKFKRCQGTNYFGESCL